MAAMRSKPVQYCGGVVFFLLMLITAVSAITDPPSVNEAQTAHDVTENLTLGDIQTTPFVSVSAGSTPTVTAGAASSANPAAAQTTTTSASPIITLATVVRGNPTDSATPEIATQSANNAQGTTGPTTIVATPTFSTAPVNNCPRLNSQACACTPGGMYASDSRQKLPSVQCMFTSNPTSPLLYSPAAGKVSLDTLDMSGSGLHTLPDDFFQGLENITTLNLARNVFSVIPQAVLMLHSLPSLDMSDNVVETLQLLTVVGIRNLTVLNLAHNKLTRLEHGQYDQQPQSQYLQTMNVPGVVPQLTILNLSNNAIETIADDFFTAMGHLSILDLSHNRLTLISDHTFHTLKFSLAVLDLSNNALRQMTPGSLQHLSHLHELRLAYNTLGNISALEFPPHLERLDLSHSALTAMNHCQMSSLSDLKFIALNGNDLQCDCQLYYLLTWYLSEHHVTSNPQVTTAPSTTPTAWTCILAPATPNYTTSEGGEHHTDQNRGPVLVSELENCQDSESHCHSMEHMEHHSQGSGQLEVTLKVATSGLELMATWEIEENAEAVIDGYRLQYIPEDSKTISSPVLPHDARSYKLDRTEMEKHYMVCLEVLAPELFIIRQVCKNIKDEPTNVVVGIMAGVVFLLPCIGAIIYIVLKDRSIHKSMGYDALSETDVDNLENGSAGLKSLECKGQGSDSQSSKCESNIVATVNVDGDCQDSASQGTTSQCSILAEVMTGASSPVSNGHSSTGKDGKEISGVVTQGRESPSTSSKELSENLDENAASPRSSSKLSVESQRSSGLSNASQTSSATSGETTSQDPSLNEYTLQRADSQTSLSAESVATKAPQAAQAGAETEITQTPLEDQKLDAHGANNASPPSSEVTVDLTTHAGKQAKLPKDSEDSTCMCSAKNENGGVMIGLGHHCGIDNPAFVCDGECTNPLHEFTKL